VNRLSGLGGVRCITILIQKPAFNLPSQLDVVVVRVGDYEEEVATAEDLERLCKKLKEELQKSGCRFNSWYIRISPDRLLNLLKKAYIKYTQGVVSTAEVIAEFLEENRLAKSLYRTITPTLSSLGLAASGKFTSAAIEIGRLIAEGKSGDVKSRLRDLVYKNCVLREIIEKARDCSELERAVEDVLTAYGKSVRFDELKYTAELLRMVHPKCEECDLSCPSAERLQTCAERLIQLSYPHIRELFEKLDISLLPEHLDYVPADKSAYLLRVKGTAKHIGMVLMGGPVESADLQQLKMSLLKLDERVAEGVYEVYIKIIPILEGEGCRPLKLLIEVVRGDLERASKIVKLSS
jgi:hypothetical protein